VKQDMIESLATLERGLHKNAQVIFDLVWPIYSASFVGRRLSSNRRSSSEVSLARIAASVSDICLVSSAYSASFA
jgi:hypothetical protein